MKPFAFAVQLLSGSENERWGLFVDGMRLGSFSKRDAEDRAFLINAAFESRLKEELEKFRENCFDIVMGDQYGMVTDEREAAHNADIEAIAEKIRLLPTEPEERRSGL